VRKKHQAGTLPLIAKLTSIFVDGFFVFRRVSPRIGFCPFICALEFSLLDTLIGHKEWRASERLTSMKSQKNENPTFSIGK
jgi:hypothetical protein